MTPQRVRFTLFRLQAHKPDAADLYDQNLAPRDIIQSAINEKPDCVHRGVKWQLRNVVVGTDSNPDAIFFAVGKPSEKDTPTTNESGDFCQIAFEHAPHAYAIIDLGLQVVAIQQGGGLGSQATAVAQALRSLLQSTAVVRDNRVKIAIDALLDPKEFIDAILGSAALTQLTVTFTLPNIFDRDDFQEDVQQATRLIGADKGIVTFKGEDLDKDEAVSLIRAGSSIGKRCLAMIRRKTGERPRKVQVSNNPVDLTVPVRDLTDPSQRVQLTDVVMSEIKDAYDNVRHSD